MNQSLPMDEALNLSRKMEALYGQQQASQSFGAWILDTFYPETIIESLVSGRDFYCVARTSDARMYLTGMLASGSLPATPLLDAVGAQPDNTI